MLDLLASVVSLLQSNWGCPRQNHLLHLSGDLQMDLLHWDELKLKQVHVSVLDESPFLCDGKAPERLLSFTPMKHLVHNLLSIHSMASVGKIVC